MRAKVTMYWNKAFPEADPKFGMLIQKEKGERYNIQYTEDGEHVYLTDNKKEAIKKVKEFNRLHHDINSNQNISQSSNLV